jgi:hypothetical protein
VLDEEGFNKQLLTVRDARRSFAQMLGVDWRFVFIVVRGGDVSKDDDVVMQLRTGRF